jgi:sugar phosphate isomerase/epimerase
MRWSFASIVLVPRGAWGASPTVEERRRVFAWAAEAGFEGVELSPRWLAFHAMDAAELAALRADLDAARLEVSGLCISRCILTRTQEADEHWARLERGVDVARALGAKLITISQSMPTIPTPDRPVIFGRDLPEEEHRRAAGMLKALARKARPAGVELSLELHDDGLCDEAGLLERLVGWIDEPNVGVNPDLGNIVRGGGPLPDWEGTLRRLAPRANNWHVKNYAAATPVPPWDAAGDIDYRRAVSIMKGAGYRGWVGIECYFGDVLGFQKEGLRYLKSLDESTP